MEPPPSRVRVGVERFAPIATLSVAFLLAFRRIDDFDSWWHLATGRWIVAHGTIPATDVLSHTVRGHPWINLEWAYEVALYLLYAAGGPLLLCLAAAAAFTSAVWLLLRLVRPHLGFAGGSILILAVTLVMQDRFAVRPEMISFPLLAGVLSIIDHAGRREGRRLWLLVPLMLVWVNVHALFVIGAFAILCAILGTPSRMLTLWGLGFIVETVPGAVGDVTVILSPASLFSSSGLTQQPYPASEYVDLGVKVKATPAMHPNHEVTLQLEFEIRALSGSSVNGIPIISNRTLTQTVRVKEDEPTLIGGITDTEETRAITGLPGFAEIPGVGYAFGQRNNSLQDTGLLIVVTPRRLRSCLAI
jgi:hypothetical protein